MLWLFGRNPPVRPSTNLIELLLPLITLSVPFISPLNPDFDTDLDSVVVFITQFPYRTIGGMTEIFFQYRYLIV